MFAADFGVRWVKDNWLLNVQLYLISYAIAISSKMYSLKVHCSCFNLQKVEI